jgi:hypothetical protein
MKPKVFIPKNAGLTKSQIWTFFYSEHEKKDNKVFCYVVDYDDDDGYRVPAFTCEEIPDKLCQEFVDKEHELRDEGMDEEDFVDERQDLTRLIFKKICKALNRSAK